MAFYFNPNSNVYSVLCKYTLHILRISLVCRCTSFTWRLIDQKTNEIKFGQLSGVFVCFMSYSEPSSTCKHTPFICYTLLHQPKHSHTHYRHSHKRQSKVWSQSKIAESDKVCQMICIITKYIRMLSTLTKWRLGDFHMTYTNIMSRFGFYMTIADNFSSQFYVVSIKKVGTQYTVCIFTTKPWASYRKTVLIQYTKAKLCQALNNIKKALKTK